MGFPEVAQQWAFAVVVSFPEVGSGRVPEGGRSIFFLRVVDNVADYASICDLEVGLEPNRLPDGTHGTDTGA